MKNWYIAFGLCAFLWSWGQNYNNVIDKKVYKSGIDFSGEWKLDKIDDKDPLKGESFIITIEKSNGKYVGNYCRIIDNGLKKDCPNKQNLTATLEGEKLYLLMLSQWGGMVKGHLEVVDIHTLRWKRDQQLGEAFIPQTAIFKGENNLFSETEIYLIPPFDNKKIGDFKKAKLTDANITLDVFTNLSNTHYLAEIKSSTPRIQTFLFSDCNKKDECKRYLVTINSEGESKGLLPLTPEEVVVDAKTKIVDKAVAFEIDQDFIITVTINRYKKDRLISTYNKQYIVNFRGEIEEFKNDKT